jgi:hypothetical protein
LSSTLIRAPRLLMRSMMEAPSIIELVARSRRGAAAGLLQEIEAETGAHMRKRRNSTPPVVERKHKRVIGAPAQRPAPALPRAAPDRTIRGWNAADDLERREEIRFNGLSEHEKITAACEVLKARLRRANDPRVLH